MAGKILKRLSLSCDFPSDDLICCLHLIKKMPYLLIFTFYKMCYLFLENFIYLFIFYCLQISNTVLYFSDVLWPEFTIWNLLAAIIHFQRHASEPTIPKDMSDRKLKFTENLERKRWQELEKYIT